MTLNYENIKTQISKLLQEIEPKTNDRDGLKLTPHRVAKMYQEIFAGYNMTPETILKTRFLKEFSGEIIVQEIQFYSMCEHHMAPFFGTVKIEYIPGDCLMGLSKFVRLVECYSKRLQIQERLTNQILDAIMFHGHAKACRITIEARHLCMHMRGVKNFSTITTTISKKGEI